MNVHDPAVIPTRDHVLPRSRGGRVTVPACWTCNNIKGDMTPQQWEAFMQANPQWWITFARGKVTSRNPAEIERIKADKKATGRALSGKARKALLRSVLSPEKPREPSGVLIYSTEEK